MGVITSFVDSAVSGGYLAALALVCLIQYVLHYHQSLQARRDRELYEHEMQGLAGELEDVHRERLLTNLENHLLREFVSQTEIAKAVDLLLRSYAPNPDRDFTALIRYRDEAAMVYRSRGLSDESQESMKFQAGPFRDMLPPGKVVCVERPQLAKNAVFRVLATIDQNKAQRLFLMTIGDRREPLGFLVSTSLYPANGPREQQIGLAERLLTSVSWDFQQRRSLVRAERELRTTNDQLRLRAITDRDYKTPMEMVQDYIHALARILDVRVTMFVPSGGNEWTPLQRSCDLNTSVHRFEKQEAQLIAAGMGHTSVDHLSQSELRSLGIELPAREALLLPVTQQDESLGVLCCTKTNEEPFTDANRELVTWAANHLAEELSRMEAVLDIQRQALEDSLTGLANRRYFDQRIHGVLRGYRGNGHECSLLLCDLDHFKHVNDTWGHSAGDAVLRSAAKVLQEQALCTRSNDRVIVARYGGEEFALLLPGIGRMGAERIAECIREGVESDMVEFEGRAIQVTASIGLATFPDDAENVQELINRADAALYDAKSSGRNRVAVYTSSMEAEEEPFASEQSLATRD